MSGRVINFPKRPWSGFWRVHTMLEGVWRRVTEAGAVLKKHQGSPDWTEADDLFLKTLNKAWSMATPRARSAFLAHQNALSPEEFDGIKGMKPEAVKDGD